MLLKPDKSRCQHITPLLLRSKERVDFKLAVFIFRCLHGLAPRYLSDDIRRVADTNRRLLRSASSGVLFARPTRLITMGDRAFAVDSGTICRTRSPLLPRCLFSPAVERHTCFNFPSLPTIHFYPMQASSGLAVLRTLGHYK